MYDTRGDVPTWRILVRNQGEGWGTPGVGVRGEEKEGGGRLACRRARPGGHWVRRGLACIFMGDGVV